MPSKKNVSPAPKQSVPENKGFFSNIQWGESYVSLFLGAVVVIVAAALGLFYVKLHQPKGQILPPVQIVRQVQLTVTPNSSSSAQQTTATPVIHTPTKTFTATPTKSTALTHTSTITQKPKNTQTPTSQPTFIVTKTPTTKTQNTKTPTPTKPSNNQKTYIVQKNDDLWHIAVKEYGSGYSWVSIAQVNHLANPGLIFSGDMLIIPSVTPILVQNTVSTTPTPMPTAKPSQPKVLITPTPSQHNSITGNQYTVQHGDSLWDIAIRAYGDGYKWVTIAQANHLANPSVIHSGNVLIIPRSKTL